MNYQIVTKNVTAQPLAAVRRRVRVENVSSVWKPALDLVWEFLRHHERLHVAGHNCFLFRHLDSSVMDVDFGFQVIRTFEGEGEVVCTETPAGEVAMTTHIGSYDGLGAAHNAIAAWRAATGRG